MIGPETLDRTDRGLSPVVSVALLVLIVLLLAASASVFALGFADSIPDTKSAIAQGNVQVSISPSSVDNTLVMVHDGGQSIPKENLKVTVRTAAGSTVEGGAVVSGDDDAWDPSEKLSVALDEDEVCSGTGDSAHVTLVYDSGASGNVIADIDVPVVRDVFDIANGEVVPNDDYEAETKVIGAGYTAGAHGSNIPIEVSVAVGATTEQPWGGDINDGNNPRSKVYAGQDAGTGISVTADPNGGAPVNSKADAGDEVYVLEDGDTPPNLAGFGDQDSAASYVAPYLDDDGNIDLQANQAIFLFELSGSTTGPAADFQDVVVLVSLTPEEQLNVEEGDGDGFIACPDTS